MASKYFSLVLILFLSSKVESASLLERSYEYVMSFGKSLAPNLATFMDCFGEEDPWSCAKTKVGKMLENWDEDLNKQRSLWQDAADSEVMSSGRSIEEMPSKLGKEVEVSLIALADLMQNGMSRALSERKHHSSGSIDSITISTGSGDKKKKKKKQKPPKIHLVHPATHEKQDRGFGSMQSWAIGSEDNENVAKAFEINRSKNELKDSEESEAEDVEDNARGTAEHENLPGFRRGRDIITDMWAMGEKAVDALAEHAVENENADNGIEDKSSVAEQRGKKKKKKKAILKLLILGAVLKAKIGTLLQILSFKLQVKFFLIALIGLAINLARFWLDVKKSHHQQPQKVIYYEHAQHQHHYDHEEEGHGWGPWSRSIPPEEVDSEVDVEFDSSPYRAQVDRNAQLQQPRPTLIRV